MIDISARRILSLAALCAVAACSSPGGSAPALAPASGTAQVKPQAVNPILANIVGVGDSLTAGYQADGMLGQANAPNPLDHDSVIPPTQENGFWAILDEQASGLPISDAIAREFDPARSPLPLIAGPGINNQIVPDSQPPGFQMFKANQCTYDDNFNAKGYFLQQSAVVRMNPKSTTIRDLAVPGISLHEANTLTQPQSTTCEPLPGILGELAAVVDQESSTFWPVLRNFSYMGSNLTMTKAAAQLKPSLAVVWLGANDVLKYMGSGGRFVGGDNTVGQVSSDLESTINTLTRSGAKVVTANLPNILLTPYFMRTDIPRNTNKICPSQGVTSQTYVFCVWYKITADYQAGTYVAKTVAQQYHLQTPGGCTPGSTTKPCGYLTLQGTFAALLYSINHPNEKDPEKPNLPDFDNGKPGSGLGMYYITPAFAAKIQALNDTINTGLNQAAEKTNTPIVDVTAFFDGVASGDPNNPYYKEASHIGPPSEPPCCGLGFGSGLVSFDGLHPSNTGYALLAADFIDVINHKYGTKIPQVNVKAVYGGTRCNNSRYCYREPYALFNFL
jgi:lysophospholipase L1-like esterase